MNKIEKRVLIIFFSAIFLWVFRTLINPLIPALKLSDAGISMLAALSLFAIPFEFNKGTFAFFLPKIGFAYMIFMCMKISK